MPLTSKSAASTANRPRLIMLPPSVDLVFCGRRRAWEPGELWHFQDSALPLTRTSRPVRLVYELVERDIQCAFPECAHAGFAQLLVAADDREKVVSCQLPH